MHAGLTYNAVGDVTGANYTDNINGSNVADAVATIDDKGRAGITTETAPNPASPTGAPITTTSTQAFTPNDQLQSDKSGPTGATTVYGYYATNSGTANGASPGALQSVKLVATGVTLSETDYAYDPTTGRMNQITIVGQNGAPNQVFAVAYKPNTNLISGISAPGSSASFQYDSQNGRLTNLGANQNGSGVASTPPTSVTTTTISATPRRLPASTPTEPQTTPPRPTHTTAPMNSTASPQPAPAAPPTGAGRTMASATALASPARQIT